MTGSRRTEFPDGLAKVGLIVAAELESQNPRFHDKESFYKAVCELDPQTQKASSVKSNVNDERLTKSQFATIAGLVGSQPPHTELRAKDPMALKQFLEKPKTARPRLLLEQSDRPENWHDHLVSIEISVAQKAPPMIPVGGEARVHGEIRCNISRVFPNVAGNVGLGAIHVRLASSVARVSNRLEAFDKDDVRSLGEIRVKARGSESPYFEIDAVDSVLDGVISTIFATFTGLAVDDDITGTVSAFVKDVEPSDPPPLDSLRNPDGEALDHLARERVIARLQAMALPEPEMGLIALGRHRIVFREAGEDRRGERGEDARQ